MKRFLNSLKFALIIFLPICFIPAAVWVYLVYDEHTAPGGLDENEIGTILQSLRWIGLTQLPIFIIAFLGRYLKLIKNISLKYSFALPVTIFYTGYVIYNYYLASITIDIEARLIYSIFCYLAAVFYAIVCIAIWVICIVSDKKKTK